MQDNLIWSGDTFFSAADDHMHNNKGHRNPTPPPAPREEAVPFDDCDYRTGDLPTGKLPDGSLTACAPLGVGYVPVQRSSEPTYEPDNALTRGTLFPGLDPPFMDAANKNNPYAGTPLGELMAISFATHELTLYLDTHPRDKSAFAALKKMLRLKKDAHSRFTRKFGPISADDLLDADSFTWVHGPWPWETPAPGSTSSNTDSGR